MNQELKTIEDFIDVEVMERNLDEITLSHPELNEVSYRAVLVNYFDPVDELRNAVADYLEYKPKEGGSNSFLDITVPRCSAINAIVSKWERISDENQASTPQILVALPENGLNRYRNRISGLSNVLQENYVLTPEWVNDDVRLVRGHPTVYASNVKDLTNYLEEESTKEFGEFCRI